MTKYSERIQKAVHELAALHREMRADLKGRADQGELSSPSDGMFQIALQYAAVEEARLALETGLVR